MRVHITIEDPEMCSYLAAMAEQEGMTVNEWVNRCLEDGKYRFMRCSRDVRAVNGRVRLIPKLLM